MSKSATSILRVRFVVAVKLGGDELQSWHHDRNHRYPVEATQAGMIFTVGSAEVVVPWPNVVSYERGVAEAKS